MSTHTLSKKKKIVSNLSCPLVAAVITVLFICIHKYIIYYIYIIFLYNIYKTVITANHS